MKRKLGLVAAAGVLAASLMLLLSACGGGGGSDGVASLTTPSQSGNDSQGSDGDDSPSDQERERAQLEFAKCMREHGVDFPDPVNGRFEFKGERRDERKSDEAQRACGHILEDVAPPPLDEQQKAELSKAVLEFAKCMRAHGIDMPDPKVSANGGMLLRMPAGAEDDAKFAAAQKACQPILDAAERSVRSAQGGSS